MDDATLRLEREIHLLAQHLRARPKSLELHLDRSAYAILLLLDHTGPITLREIAQHLELEQSTVNRQVNKAITVGLLEAAGAGGPKRIDSTEAGRAALNRDREAKLRTIAAVLADIAEPHREALISGLAALNVALEARAGA